MGGMPIAGQEDWYRWDWWGEYCTTFAPWLFHAEHGFLYRDPTSTNESMYLYDNGWKHGAGPAKTCIRLSTPLIQAADNEV